MFQPARAFLSEYRRAEYVGDDRDLFRGKITVERRRGRVDVETAAFDSSSSVGQAKRRQAIRTST